LQDITMIRIALLFLLMVSVSFKTDRSPREQVRWTSVTCLSKNDFRKTSPGRPIKTKTGKRTYRMLEGFINTGIAYSFERTGDFVHYELYAFMLPDDSWLLDRDDPETLEHEQAHFNITEIYARKMRSRLSRVKNQEAAKRIYRQLMDDLQRKQADFDRYHERENGVAPEWKKWIEGSLKELEAFKETEVIPV
jgi:hypothetical protein